MYNNYIFCFHAYKMLTTARWSIFRRQLTLKISRKLHTSNYIGRSSDCWSSVENIQRRFDNIFVGNHQLHSEKTSA